MEWYIIPIAIGIGFCAGFINTLAGGGSLLTLPLLMFMGLPANVANGTNRIALIAQNIIATASFRQQKVLDFRQGFFLALPAIIGSVIGAQIAVNLDEDMMKKTIGGLLIVMFFIIIYKPDRWLKSHKRTTNEGIKDIKTAPLPCPGHASGLMALLNNIARHRRKIIQVIIFFCIGLYGGFIQAGVGFFLLAALVLGAGIDLVRANAVKLLIVLIYNIFAFAVFIFNDQVDWILGLIVAAGNMAGAFVGSRVAVSWGPKFVRIILLITLVGS
ncbi:MAG: sulfite exporter TauE/SafE family protein, partial [Bacteroidetes bacterium]|nr:sulfite exporter TauE/SafE family protein [Bacteroidota bacterium]